MRRRSKRFPTPDKRRPNSLLILPAAAAKNIAANARQYVALSVAIALVSGVSGLVLSYYFNTATGATIVLVAMACFLATLAIRRLRAAFPSRIGASPRHPRTLT